MPIPPVSGPAAPAAPAAPVPRRSFDEALDRRLPRERAAGGDGPAQTAAAALEGVERARRRLDAILEAARSGRTFSAQELLGLQASAYRYAQTVDLASKVVESGAQSVKQALNTQV